MIFTRPPVLGKVKTRLAADIGDEAALNIYNFLLNHTVSVTRDLEVRKEVHYSEEIISQDIWNSDIYDKKLQQGNDLGERMQHAFEDGFRSGYQNIIIIGSDLFDLCMNDIQKAFSLLKDNDFVLGPAEDGGYYLLGMKKMLPQLFQHKKWGTASVFQETVKDLREEGVAYLEYRNDIDVYADLKGKKEFQQFLKVNNDNA